MNRTEDYINSREFTLGQRIAFVRKYLRISQEMIGQQIFNPPKSRQYVAAIEDGSKSPTYEELQLLARLFRCPSVDYLLKPEIFHTMFTKNALNKMFPKINP